MRGYDERTRLQQETADNLKSMFSEQQIISAHHPTITCMMCGSQNGTAKCK